MFANVQFYIAPNLCVFSMDLNLGINQLMKTSNEGEKSLISKNGNMFMLYKYSIWIILAKTLISEKVWVWNPFHPDLRIYFILFSFVALAQDIHSPI